MLLPAPTKAHCDRDTVILFFFPIVVSPFLSNSLKNLLDIQICPFLPLGIPTFSLYAQHNDYAVILSILF